MSIGVTAERTVLGDATTFARRLEAALDELEAAGEISTGGFESEDDSACDRGAACAASRRS